MLTVVRTDMTQFVLCGDESREFQRQYDNIFRLQAEAARLATVRLKRLCEWKGEKCEWKGAK
jgi:hypothetical protein